MRPARKMTGDVSTCPKFRPRTVTICPPRGAPPLGWNDCISGGSYVNLPSSVASSNAPVPVRAAQRGCAWAPRSRHGTLSRPQLRDVRHSLRHVFTSWTIRVVHNLTTMTAAHEPVPELDRFFASDGDFLHREFLRPLEGLGLRSTMLRGLLRHQFRERDAHCDIVERTAPSAYKPTEFGVYY